MGRVQSGYVYEASGALYVRYWTSEIVDGKPQRVQRSERLCGVDDKHYLSRVTDKKTGKKRLVISSALKLKLNDKMQKVNSQEVNRRPGQDMTVDDFWEIRYLPYCEETVALTGEPRKKPSTVRGYKQIWNQHLKEHFADTTLQGYEPWMGTDLLQSLTAKQGKATLKHIKALGGSIFKRAVIERRIKVNPWHDVEMSEDAVESDATPHYTLEEVEDIISALVDHVDCQLVLALACFLGLRPGEIAALKWEDFDTKNDLVHIRRSVVRGVVGTPKTPESLASLPLPAQVRIPLELWRQQVQRDKAELKARLEAETSSKTGKGIDDESNGYLFESRNGTPVDLHNLTSRVIRPHVEGSDYKIHGKAQECIRCNKVPKSSGREWKTLYAGRRCAATAVIEANNGNLAIGQPDILLKRQLNLFTMSGTPMKAIAVIPARLASTRLPRKMLLEITGKPLIGVVYEAVRSSTLLADVIIATDSDEILQVCREHGWKGLMTSPDHRSGTERVHEISGREAADVYINVQGDEPLVRPEQIATLLHVMENPAVQVGTLMTPAGEIDIPNPNAVKVVTDLSGRALYFSRATIPFDRDGTQPRYFKHLGLYAYRKPALDRFVALPESSLEKGERLEQLRFLENGISIYVGETPQDSVGVDTEEDLQRVIKILGAR